MRRHRSRLGPRWRGPIRVLKQSCPVTYIVRDPISAHRDDDPNDDADDLPDDTDDPKDPSGDCYLPQMEERNQPEPGDPQPSHRYELTDSDDD